MRIALVAHHARATGGQDRYLLELARHLAPRHEVHVVAVRAEGLEGTSVTVHELGLPDRPVLALEPRFARRAAAAVHGQRFDIVHGVGGSLPGASVITAQYVHAAWHDARRRYHVKEDSLLDGWYHALVRAQAVAYDRRAYGHPALKAVIAVSRTTAAELTRHYGVAADRITVVHNGADPALFDPARYPWARAELRRELKLAPDALVALLVGTYARKGLETAIHAVARASDTLHLVVAGAGDAAQARAWARAARLENRLHLLGPRSDVGHLYAASDLFVLPTRYEPFGMVIAEAMAAQLPVVVSGASGAAELITPGVSGCVVERADDVAGFAAQIKALILDPAKRSAMGRAARQAALAVDWPHVAEQTEAVYRAALRR